MQSTVIFEHWEILLKWRAKIRTGKLVSNERKDVIPNRRRTGYLIKERKGYNKGEKSVSKKERIRYKTRERKGFLMKERKMIQQGRQILYRRKNGDDTK